MLNSLINFIPEILFSAVICIFVYYRVYIPWKKRQPVKKKVTLVKTKDKSTSKIVSEEEKFSKAKLNNLVWSLVIYGIVLWIIHRSSAVFWENWWNPWYFFLGTNIVILLCIVLMNLFPKATWIGGILGFFLLAFLYSHHSGLQEEKKQVAIEKSKKDFLLPRPKKIPRSLEAKDYPDFPESGVAELLGGRGNPIQAYLDPKKTWTICNIPPRTRGGVLYMHAIDTTFKFRDTVPSMYRCYPHDTPEYKRWYASHLEWQLFPRGPYKLYMINREKVKRKKNIFEWGTEYRPSPPCD